MQYSSESPGSAPYNEEASEGATEKENGWDLDTAPKGMEQYQTMDTDEELVAAVNGILNSSS